jgi:DNA-binding NtrC family response regulator
LEKLNILLLEDNHEFAESLRQAMKDHYRFVISTSLQEAKAIIEANNEISVALVDLFLGDEHNSQPEGIKFLRWLAGEHPDIPAVVLSGQGNMDLAVDAMKAGAEDFIDKGRLNITELKKRILDILERRRLRQENVLLRNRLEQYEARVLVGSSSVMRDLCRVIRTVAEDGHITVLLRGETGTGKELAARMIHEQGSRKGGPFAAVDVSCLPKETLASELFGYERGAFTGAEKTHKGYIEAANSGIFFLDEITDLQMEIQNRLLRVLEERVVIRLGSTIPIPVDIQLIAATSQDIEELVKTGRFRKDLYYRLKVFEVTLPALRDHLEDIPEIANHFLRQWQTRTTLRDVSPEALQLLQRYSWPGNVRELRNVLEFGALQARMRHMKTLLPEHLPAEIKTGTAVPFGDGTIDIQLNVGSALARTELECALKALRRVEGSKEEARRLLGYRDRHTMRRRIEAIARLNPKLWASYPEIEQYYGLSNKRKRK